MSVMDLETKRVFLIASQNQKLVSYLSLKVNEHISDATIFTAKDGSDALFKIDNMPPHVVIVDGDLPKIDGYELANRLISQDKYPDMSIIIISTIPDKEQFVDEVVTGKVQFLIDPTDDEKLNHSIARGLNRLADLQNLGYRVLFLVSGDVLFNEGDMGKSAYIVKTGEMKATKKMNDHNIIIGKIQTGEFVGEMAHINQEPRFATVTAVKDCELIEIPFGTLDIVLFTKPAWAKALVLTLSKRLRNAFKS
jgi:CRP/FNR family transcriptional regulator, cyclic AMP receptor protein